MLKNLPEWLAHIEKLHRLPMELGLERVGHVAALTQLAVFQCPVITVAGTNGKGSCVAFLESILRAAGYRVGAYTSPHLLRYNERIRIDGQVVTDDALCSAFKVIDLIRTTTSLSFFEFTTLAAFYLFQQAKLDCVLLEVGLGGRLDAVNIVDADIAVIASIAIDHEAWLGSTREEIGREKAGIMREQRPVVCGDTEVPHSVLEHAKELAAPLYCMNRDFRYTKNVQDWSWQGEHCHFDHLPLLRLPMQNAATSLMVVELLQSHFWIDETSIRQGLANACLPGRFQRIAEPSTTVICDVAHNPASAALLAEQLRASPMPTGAKQIAVVGMLADKDIKQTLKQLAKLIDSWYIGSLNVPRGAKASVLANALASYNEGGSVQVCACFDSVEDAYLQALANAGKQDRIIVFGSFYTVSAVVDSGP